MIIFRRELTTNFKALIIWSIALSAIILLMLSLYPQMAEQGKDLAKLLEAYPEGLREAFGMDTLDMSTLIGFYSVESFMMLTLFGSIYAAILAGGILSKEESDHTAEFLLSKPVTRNRIVSEKLILVIMNLVIFNVVVMLASLIGFQFATKSEMPMDTYFLLVVGAFLLHLTFAAISFLFSSFVRKSRKILSIALGLVLVSYFLSIAAGLSDKLSALSYVTPFDYVKASEIVANNQLDWVYVLLMGVIITVSISAAYVIYHRKDMSV
jgi:ABC-2 type transport system permease protein